MVETRGDDLRDFVQSLRPGSAAADALVYLFQQMSQRGSESQVAPLRERLREVCAEIDARNKERGRLKGYRDILTRGIEAVGSAITEGYASTSMRLFYIVLQEEKFRVDSDIAQSSPAALLEEKAYLRKELKRLGHLQEILALVSQVRGRDGS